MLKHCGTVKIETERLVLRPFMEQDTEYIFNTWASDMCNHSIVYENNEMHTKLDRVTTYETKKYM